ncbi:MAG: hypothetical protein Q8O34_00985 [Rhodocyclaceae bacterium]|nr:hypothetical protein [Rhodocyclaceae bacterium]
MYEPEDFFRERRVLVIGGSSGIGPGIGAAFARRGTQVTVTGATATEVAAALTAMDFGAVAPIPRAYDVVAFLESTAQGTLT